ncbi:MAG TPA: DoxX family protein [Sulfurovum sp.]|jgi:putative oxidoreductase|nr:MAG: GntR family transcriptional regulator [Sulfurovum sp. 35-42-20]OYZ24452.1 MAG: GntR family transcriptional regulator [Sulfurovum sp. 16-42-52]OYZ48349.1 MAG: GntR family transcriptional regulator [Sulfurovum sp. 24-42-9]OZA44235.1 MAG: GntR family transcriptional regulator [Sulfurovum sp. 17-42-90]OZA61186.1 MAG: GntR family transcriptional regulator [Sulfurovum sp. 39-42-12]HQR73030.1 DoxX family protein [Sulfurovum sp.]
MSEHLGKLILRVMIGGMMLFHGIEKALHGIGFIKGVLNTQHIPEVLAYGVYVGEIFAPLFLIIGWQSRFWGGVLAFNMLVAIYLTKSTLWLSLGEHGAWALELPMLYLLGGLAIVFLGSGKYAIIPD